MDFLSQPWWQGVAGFAQVLAAIFSIVSLWQARKAIKLAQQANEDSLAPYFGFASMNPPVGKNRTLVFTNCGFGPARNLKGTFVSSEGDHINVTLVGNSGIGQVIFPNNLLSAILLLPNIQNSIEGELTINCSGRVKDHCMKFKVLITEKGKVTVDEL